MIVIFLYFIRKRKDLDASQTKRHSTEVAAAVETISAMINPFSGSTEELVNIVSGEVATSEIKKDLLSAKRIGEEKLALFVEKKVMAETPDIFSTIPRTKLKTFSSTGKTVTAKNSKGKLVDVRNDTKFIARILAVGKSREVDFENLMSYSLHIYPSAFATSNGQLQKTPKVKLLHTLENRVPDACISALPGRNALLLDGMAMVQTMKDLPDTFGALAEKLLQRVINEGRKSQSTRVDLVNDTYPDVSIKNLERDKRAGAGTTQIKILNASQKIPRQFKKFLSLGKNKESLIEFTFRWVFLQL